MQIVIDTKPEDDTALTLVVDQLNATKDPAAPDLTVERYLQQQFLGVVKSTIAAAPLQKDLDAVIALWATMTPDQRATIKRTVAEAFAAESIEVLPPLPVNVIP